MIPQINPLEHRSYLVDGEIKPWTGEIQDVYSTLCKTSGASYEKTRVGSVPNLGEKEA